jgi:hypothetical protein
LRGETLHDLRNKLNIDSDKIREINSFLLSDQNPIVTDVLSVVDSYGGIDEINRRARENGKTEVLMSRLEAVHSPFVKDLEWLQRQTDSEAFINVQDYRRRILGNEASSMKFKNGFPVTLEISGLNFFPWIIEEAKRALSRKELMPARYIRVRSMKEQTEDGDILALSAAMNIIGGSYVQTPDTKGTLTGPDGFPINPHLGGQDTLTGYFGGIGVPNEYAIEWVREVLHYYTEYGIPQFLTINPGTALLGFWLYRLGVDIEFKISVYMGTDNPYSVLWIIMMAKMFSRDRGKSPLTGLNLSNSVNGKTLEEAAFVRNSLGFEETMRLEHHVTEAYRGIVIQPYDRTDELLRVADHVKNLGAKHEGGLPEVEVTRDHPSDILDYFVPKSEIESKGLMPKLLVNYLDKHDALNRTAEILTKKGLTFSAASKLHRE